MPPFYEPRLAAQVQADHYPRGRMESVLGSFVVAIWKGGRQLGVKFPQENAIDMIRSRGQNDLHDSLVTPEGLQEHAKSFDVILSVICTSL